MAIKHNSTYAKGNKVDMAESPSIAPKSAVFSMEKTSEISGELSINDQVIDAGKFQPKLTKPPVTTKKAATKVDIENAQPSTKLNFGGGFQMLVNEKGVKYFQFRYSIDGKSSTLNIGRYPDISFEEAMFEMQNKRDSVIQARGKKREKAFKVRLNKPRKVKDNWNVGESNFKSIDEAVKFIGELFNKDNGMAKELQLATWLQMLIPSRSSELLCAKWSDIDLGNRQWNINSQSLRLINPDIEYLSDAACTALHELQSLYIYKDYLFPRLSNLNFKKADRDRLLVEEIERIWMNYQPNMFLNFFITMAGKFSYFQPEFIEAIARHKDHKSNIYNSPYLFHQRGALAYWWGDELTRLRTPKLQMENLLFTNGVTAHI